MDVEKGPSDKSNLLNNKQDELPWWLRFLARSVATAAGLITVILAVFSFIAIDPLCYVKGILLICIGFILIVLEAPCCCQFLDFVDRIAKFSDNRPYWQKAVGYIILSIIPLPICSSLTSIGASVCVFIAGSLYAVLAMGKKADRNVMLQRAAGKDEKDELQMGLVKNEAATPK